MSDEVTLLQTKQWIHDFAKFANNLNPIAAFPHKSITNSFYWSWNGNNYPQLGLVNNVRDPMEVLLQVS